MTSRILAIETAVPQTVLSQSRARDLLAGQPGRSRLGVRLTHAAFDASAIESRFTVLPELVPGTRTEGHLKRCHITNPDVVFEREVLPEIAPDLVEER